MTIDFTCRHCGKQFHAPDTLAGQQARCQGCGQIVTVPTLRQPAEPGMAQANGGQTPPAAQHGREPAGAAMTQPAPTPAGSRAAVPATAGVKPPKKATGTPLDFLWSQGRPTGIGWTVLASLGVGFAAVLAIVIWSCLPEKLPDDQEHLANVVPAKQDETARRSVPGPSASTPRIRLDLWRLGRRPPTKPGDSKPLPCQDSDIERFEVSLIGNGDPSPGGRVWVYGRKGYYEWRSASCLLISPLGAGTAWNCPLDAQDESVHVAFARAGFVVVAYELAGENDTDEQTNSSEIMQAYPAFKAPSAALASAHDALEYATTHLRWVDPFNVYVVGQGTGGTVALVLSTKESGIEGCVAIAPVTDLAATFGSAGNQSEQRFPGIREAINKNWPGSRAMHLDASALLLQAQNGPSSSVADIAAVADELRRFEKEVDVKTTADGGADGIVPAVVDWASRHGAKLLGDPVAEDRLASSATSLMGEGLPSRTVASNRDSDTTTANRTEERPERARYIASYDDPWSVMADPATDGLEVAPDLVLRANEACGPLATAVFPATCGRYVALGFNRSDEDSTTVWDIVSKQPVGTIAGKLPFRSQRYALSPDGKYMVGEPETDASDDAGSMEVWSVQTGQRVGKIRFSDHYYAEHYGFSAADRLVVAAADRSVDVVRDQGESRGGSAYAIKVLSVPAGETLLEISTIWRYESLVMPISHGGRYVAILDGQLVVYDLETGEIAGARPFPDDPQRRWRCEAASFSPHGTALVALFDTLSSPRLLCWNLSDGAVTSDFIVDQQGYGLLIQTTPKKWIEWFPDERGWLLPGRFPFAVDRQTGQTVWAMNRKSEAPVRLIEDRLLWTVDDESAILFALQTTFAKAPDPTKHPAGVSLTRPRTQRATVRLQVLAYRGSAQPMEAARRALAGLPGVDADKISIDAEKREIVVGARGSVINTAPMKAALERVGFSIGRAQMSMGR